MNPSQPNQQNVLIIISNLSLGGGAERVASWLADALPGQSDRYRTEILTFYKEVKAYPCKTKQVSLNEPMRHSFLGKLFRAPKRIWRIARHCKRNNITTAVSFLEESNFYLLLSTILLRVPVKTVVSVRNNPRKKNKLYRILMKWLYPHADVVIPNSKGIADMLKRDIGLSNIQVIYNPVDKVKISEYADQPIPADDKGFFSNAEHITTFITVGRLIPQKGQWHLIRAFQEVHDEHPSTRLLICGDGRLKPELVGLVEKADLIGSVIFSGKKDNIFPYLAHSDWFVLSSLWEGMPNALLEALAVGLPAISTDCQTGPREILLKYVEYAGVPTYPHQTPYGTLVAPLSGRQVFESVSHTPLDPQESQLAEVMKRALQEGKEKSKHDLDMFAPRRIVEQWKKVIHNSHQI